MATEDDYEAYGRQMDEQIARRENYEHIYPKMTDYEKLQKIGKIAEQMKYEVEEIQELINRQWGN